MTNDKSLGSGVRKFREFASKPPTLSIVERLRLWAADNWSDPIHKDAADEIERLRAALVQVKHGAEYPDELGDVIDAALAAR